MARRLSIAGALALASLPAYAAVPAWLSVWTLRDSFGPAAIFGGIAAFFAWWGPRRRKEPKKELSFGIVHRNLLLGAVPSVEELASMTYQGIPIRRLSAVIVSIMNTGDLPIVAGDYESIARMVFDDVARIFSAVPVRCSPAHLSPSITISDTELTLAPLLLNPGDYFSLRVIVDNTSRVTARLTARVSGVKAVPALNAGVHPGFEIGSFAFWGSMSVVGVCSVWLTVASHNVVAAVFSVILATAGIGALFLTAREVNGRRRARWMGHETESLTITERL